MDEEYLYSLILKQLVLYAARDVLKSVLEIQ